MFHNNINSMSYLQLIINIFFSIRVQTSVGDRRNNICLRFKGSSNRQVSDTRVPRWHMVPKIVGRFEASFCEAFRSSTEKDKEGVALALIG